MSQQDMERGEESSSSRRNCLRQYWRRDSDQGRHIPSLSKPLACDRVFRATRPRYPTLRSLEEAHNQTPLQGKGSVSGLRFPPAQCVRDLDMEYILIFRKGSLRAFEPKDPQ